ncbi:carboxylesterase/lipase family protein [Streptomyces canus]|uniref:carboxylesterase/lipase family protein n=1 Tax=Streptomyces canus TaxID=58343 RepID=UPI00371B1AA3
MPPRYGSASGDAAPPPTAATRDGMLCGRRVGAVRAFTGIPYAAPPVGPLRFRAPQPVRPWSQEREATGFGHPCPQSNPDHPAWLDAVPSAEDCLTLNVWAPDRDSEKPRPVLIWFHGGAFAWGSAGAPVYDGARLADVGDLVVVSVNHRLNIFGYLWLGDALPQLKGDANPGHQDLVAALRWVRENIAAFGGDHRNVTLFGESGGGAKIGALLATPAAEGLFHKAIIASGSQRRVATREEAGAVASAAIRALDVPMDDLGALQELPAERLVEAATTVQNALGLLAFQPVVDGDILPAQTWDPGLPDGARDIPMIIGANRHEAVVFLPDMAKPIATDRELQQRILGFDLLPPMDPQTVNTLVHGYRQSMPQASRLDLLVAITSDLWMRHAAWIQADRKTADPRTPVFFYDFAWGTPCFGGRWALHAGELPFVFGNLDHPTAWDGQDDDALRARDDPAGERHVLAEQMMRAWAAFARHGDPSTPGLPWPAYDAEKRSTMVFARGATHAVSDPDGRRRDLMAGLPTSW